MIKGVSKRVFVVNCKNGLFEQAVFFVNPNVSAVNSDIAEEAERIVRECTSFFYDGQNKKKKNKNKTKGFFR